MGPARLSKLIRGFLICCGLPLCFSSTSLRQASVFAVFEGTSPCGDFAKPFLKISATAGCEFMKWHITLYKDQQSGQPATFRLHNAYGLPEQGTPGFIEGGQQVHLEGTWSIVKKNLPGNPLAVIYRLQNAEGAGISLLQLNEALLYPLDPDDRLMIGNAGWSYTLIRTNK